MPCWIMSETDRVKAHQVEGALRQAEEYHRSGKFQEAQQCYRAILDEWPHHPQAHYGMGMLAADAGSMDAALVHLKTALESSPDNGLYWKSYVEALGKSGRIEVAWKIVRQGQQYGLDAELLKMLTEEARHVGAMSLSGKFGAADYIGAEMLARELTDLDPEGANAWKVLGASLIQQEKWAEALGPMREAIRLAPDDPDAYYNLAIGLKGEGLMDEAEENYRNALRIQPNSADYLNNLGNLCNETGRIAEAESNFRKAIESDPDYALAYCNLGKLLRETSRLEEAEGILREAMNRRPDFSEAYGNLAAVLDEQGRLDDAEASLRRALEINPKYAEGWNDLGNILSHRGKLNEAASSFEKALSIKPNLALCHLNFGRIKTYTPDDPDLPILRQIVLEAKRDSDRMYGCFALAKACEDLGDYDEAFVHYQEGNKLRKSRQDYSIEQDRVLFSSIKTLFESPTETRVVLSEEVKPILIVGMPRSGTSLVEQILATHSLVYGAGELELLSQLTAKHMDEAQFDLASVSIKISRQYIEELGKLAKGRRFITDKMPLNFVWLGFLLLAIPDIKVVHTMRDPMATCWSNFKQNFPAKGLGFGSDIEDLAEYFKLYQDLMRFWHEKFPGRIYDLSYERLTEHQEEETRKLLDYCGLPWEEACLRFEQTERIVKTASEVQVRRKLYRGSSEAWKNFEKNLIPLKRLLA